MSLARYIKKFKEYGVRHSLEIIWRFRIDWLIQDVIVLFVKNKELENSIIIESHNDFDCNGGAFYQYLIDNGYNNKYKIVWLLKHPDNKPVNLPNNVECYPLYSPSLKKDLRICCAKYLLADNVITPKVRKEQVSIYCAHGAFGLKNVQSVSALPSSVDFALSPSSNLDCFMNKQWGLKENEGKLVHLGYPSEDVFYSAIKDELKVLKKHQYNKTILWMPTFRKGGGFNRNDSVVDYEYGIPMINTKEDMEKLNSFLNDNNVLLVIKIHPMQDLCTIKNLISQSNILVLTANDVKKYKINNYALIAGADAMISDYSSAAYAFLHADRPVGIMLSDLNEYKLGLIVDNPDDYIPGMKIITFQDMIAFISDVILEKDSFKEKRHEVFDKVYAFHDGDSCERLAHFMKLEA